MNHIQPQDELQLVLNLTITFDTVTKSSQTAPQKNLAQPEARTLDVSLEAGRGGMMVMMMMTTNMMICLFVVVATSGVRFEFCRWRAI